MFEELPPVVSVSGGVVALLTFGWRLWIWVDRRIGTELKRQDEENAQLRAELVASRGETEAQRTARYEADERAARAEARGAGQEARITALHEALDHCRDQVRELRGGP